MSDEIIVKTSAPVVTVTVVSPSITFSPAGDKGPQGPQGIQGPTGPTGSTGATGAGVAEVQAWAVAKGQA